MFRETQSKSKKKSVCERRLNCAMFGAHVTRGNHDSNKRYCEHCTQNRNVGHLFYENTEGRFAGQRQVVYIFYDFKPRKISGILTRHVPNLVCVQQFCARCEEIENCSKRL